MERALIYKQRQIAPFSTDLFSFTKNNGNRATTVLPWAIHLKCYFTKITVFGDYLKKKKRGETMWKHNELKGLIY